MYVCNSEQTALEFPKMSTFKKKGTQCHRPVKFEVL